MTHAAQQEFIQRTLNLFPQFQRTGTILEIGSQNINGTVRGLLEAERYLGIDIAQARDVDFVCPGELIELADEWSDLVISTECLEHCREWVKLVKNAIRICKRGGLMIFTFAGLYRSCHGTTDSGDPGSSPFTTDYYGNISADLFLDSIMLTEWFDRYSFEVNTLAGDSYFWGIRSSQPCTASKNSQQILIDRLARSQGQLGQALSRLAAANKKISELEINQKLL